MNGYYAIEFGSAYATRKVFDPVVQLSSQSYLVFASMLAGAPLMKSGKLKAVGVTGLTRMGGYPDLPTVSESGATGFELSNSYGIYAPAGVPPAILLAINQGASLAVNSTEVKGRLTADGSEAVAPHTPADFRESIAGDWNKWEKVIRTANIKLDPQ